MKIVRNLIALSVAAAAFPLFSATPIAYWKMEEVGENGKVADASGNGNDLELVDKAELRDGGIDGKGLYIDPEFATSRGKWTHPALGNRTISMWMRWDSGDGNDSGLPYWLSLSDMRVHGVYSSSNSKNNGNIYFGNASALQLRWCITRGIWMHVTLVIDKIDEEAQTAEVRFYQNGVLRNKNTISSIGAKGSKWFKPGTGSLGNNGVTDSRAFHGFLDEVKVYDCVLSDKEIWDEASRFGLPDAEVICHWKGDRVEGGKVPGENGTVSLELVKGVSVVDDDVFGKALQFDGMNASYAQAYASNQVPRFTFAAWLNVPVDKNTADVDPSNANNYPRIMTTSVSVPNIQMASATNSMTANFWYASSGDQQNCNNALQLKGGWTHLAISYDVTCDADSQFYARPVLYVNGKRQMTGESKVLTFDKSATSLRFGLMPDEWVRLGNGGTRPFYGKMRDVWVFGRVLTDDEVLQVARGVAKVDAGEDFSVSGASARLSGSLDRTMSGYGSPKWTLVSGPAEVTFADDSSLGTAVTIPAEGTYVFRLTNEGKFGIAESDTVTVVRKDGPATRPTLSIAAESRTVTLPEPARLTATVSDAASVRWMKSSGPGGVYFSGQFQKSTTALFTAPGSYVLTCVAERDGSVAEEAIEIAVGGTGTCAVSTDGLAAYWNFDEQAWDSVSKTFGEAKFGYGLKPSKVGYGIGDAVSSSGFAAQFNGNVKLPMADKLTLAFWMYHDDPAAGSFNSSRIFWENSLVVQYNNSSATPQLLVYLTNASNPGGGFTYTSKGFNAENLKNGVTKKRWTHVAVVVDFTDYTSAELPLSRVKYYVDGVEFAMSRVDVSGNPRDGESNYVIRRLAANNNVVKLGGIDVANRYFPGVLDEVRYYTRALSAAEIARLAMEFSPKNLPPVIDVPTGVSGTAHEALELAGAVHDDASDDIAVKWTVVAGDAANVVFGDVNAAETTVTFRRAGDYELRLTANDGQLDALSAPVRCRIVPSGAVIIVR